MKVGDFVSVAGIGKCEVLAVQGDYGWFLRDGAKMPFTGNTASAKPWVEPIRVGDLVTAGPYTYSVLAEVEDGWVLKNTKDSWVGPSQPFWIKKSDELKFHFRPEKAKS